MRQCSIFRGFRRSVAPQGYQLRLKLAPRLPVGMPSAVSPIAPLTVTPPNSFCSAPNLRSHLSSVEDSDCPAMKLVPVSARLSFADCSVW